MKNVLYEDLYRSEETHWWHVSKRRLSLEFIKRFLQIKGPKLLDIGCGTGKNIESFTSLGQAWGLDSSLHAIQFCQKRGNQNIILAEAERAPFSSASFDLITMLDALEHLDDDKALKEAARILKPNGLIIITVPAYQSLWSQWDIQLRHRRRYNRKALEFILQKNDLNILKISYMYSFLLLPAVVLRKIKSWLYDDNYPSDFTISPPLINWVGKLIARLESFIIIHAYVPFGLSLIAVVQKS